MNLTNRCLRNRGKIPRFDIGAVSGVRGPRRLKELGVIRRLTLLAALLVLTVPAVACRYASRSDAELFAVSNAVFRARVTEVRAATLTVGTGHAQTFEVVEARFEVKEILKGTPPSSGIVRDLPFATNKCSLGMVVGDEYVFFPDEHNMVFLPTGSFRFSNGNRVLVNRRLESLREIASAGPK